MGDFFRSMKLTLLSLAVLATCMGGHGSLVIPQTRNSIDRLAPQWKGGYPHIPDFPGTGRWGLANESCGTNPPSCQEGCSCSNGTDACDSGQSCFWFASGCTIGCDKCDGNGRRDGPSCRCGQCGRPEDSGSLDGSFGQITEEAMLSVSAQLERHWTRNASTKFISISRGLKC